MDRWDPALINPLAERRPVVLIDNAGVGRSTGQIPKTFTEWTKHYLDIISALDLKQVDVLGYSMGGAVAQLLALNAPKGLVRRLILVGTTPSTGKGVATAPLGPFNKLKAASTEAEQKEAFLSSFFTTTDQGKAAGLAAWDRITNARGPDRTDFVPAEGAHRQAIAFAKFMDPKQARDASYDRFHELTLPVLIANGEWFPQFVATRF
jgi:pimeloyl-ACP methyl ester carboxylesterase